MSLRSQTCSCSRSLSPKASRSSWLGRMGPKASMQTLRSVLAGMNLNLNLNKLKWKLRLGAGVGMGLVCLSGLLQAGSVTRLTLSAGEVDRVESVVQFKIPQLSPGVYALSGEGQRLLLQVGKDQVGVMIEPSLAMGTSRTYEVTPASMSEGAASVKKSVDERGAVLSFSGESGPLLSYQMLASDVPHGTAPIFAHGAHLHPVYSPSGKVVTGNYPADHPHHRGIWMSWTKTSYEGRSPDFWNMGKDKSGKLTGEVRFGELLTSWDGAVSGGFIGRHQHWDHTSGTEKLVLNEDWEVRVYPTLKKPMLRQVFDLESKQQLVGEVPLKLPKYHYGGLGVRGSQAWDAVEAVEMLTSNGDDRVAGDSSKAKWVYLGGEVDGGRCGLVVLIHPDNFRFPQPLRLNPKNPQLSVAPSQDGDWQIGPRELYVSKYRFVVLDGEVEKDLLEDLWKDYAKPIDVKIVE